MLLLLTRYKYKDHCWTARTPFSSTERLYNTAVKRLSAQIFFGSLAPINIERKASTNFLFICSATPFCSGVFGIVSSCLTPSASKYSLNSVEVYSPPLSVRRASACVLTLFQP